MMAAKWCQRMCPARAFLLQHPRPSDFVHSVLCASAIPYAVTVTALSVHTLTMAIFSGATSDYQVKILIWLTYWSYFSLTARFLLTACNSWNHVRRQIQTRRRRRKTSSSSSREKGRRCSSDDVKGSTEGQSGGTSVESEAPDLDEDETEEEMPVMYKVQWLLQNVTSCAAFIVTGLYWVIMYDPNKTESPRSINSHVLNSFLVLVDLLVSRAPFRIHHFVYSIVYILLYGLFSLLYWAAGGTNHLGQTYIYRLLDYSGRPGVATAVILMVALLGTLLTQTLLYLLFRLRQWVWRRCTLWREDEGEVPADVGVDVKVSTTSLGGRSENNSSSGGGGGRKSGSSRLEKDFSLDESSQDNLQDFGRGRDYTLASNKDAGDAVIDVDMDFEMDDMAFTPRSPGGTNGSGFRAPLQTNESQISCTDSTAALLT